MTVTEKQELYKIAERYSHYFEKNLAYVPVHVRNSKRCALLYGPFTTTLSAKTSLTSMPRTFAGQSLKVYSTSQIQAYQIKKCEITLRVT
jgi:hypothetical protein